MERQAFFENEKPAMAVGETEPDQKDKRWRGRFATSLAHEDVSGKENFR